MGVRTMTTGARVFVAVFGGVSVGAGVAVSSGVAVNSMRGVKVGRGVRVLDGVGAPNEICPRLPKPKSQASNVVASKEKLTSNLVAEIFLFINQSFLGKLDYT